MIKITHIHEDSPILEKGFEIGDSLVEINGQEVDDKFDFQFYKDDEELTIILQKKESKNQIQIELKGDDIYLVDDLEVEEVKIRSCVNNCVFCFIRQNRKDLRKSLYCRDDDYRYSFLYGNFITMSNMTQKDLDKIVTQNLTPLYVSIHSLNPDIRQKLVNPRTNGEIYSKIKFLHDHDIAMHGQVVLCPNENDGKDLENTIQKLSDLFPSFRSLSVVPVGLTKYRKNLPVLTPVDKAKAREVLDLITKYQEQCLEKYGTRFVFAADEFYLKAEYEIPPDENYEDYEQYENGIGMIRDFYNQISDSKSLFSKKSKKKKNILFATGKSFAPILEKQLTDLFGKSKTLDFKVLEIKNNFFGESITVAGLLTGGDISEQVGEYLAEVKKKYDLLVLPPSCINFDGFFLDDMKPEDIEQKHHLKVVIFKDFEQLKREIDNT